VITPLDNDEVSIIIYDATPLLEAKAIIKDQLLLVEQQATTDTLTGCYNRKMFNDLLSAEEIKAFRHDKIFSLIIFDIDNFKSVNDTFGHLVGDEVLKVVATLAMKTIRGSDIFARWGGEEFTILLPETRLAGAAILADKVRAIIALHDFGKPGHKTCSFGVAEFCAEQEEQSLINNADRAMYHAKNNGKDQVAIFDHGSISTWEKS